MAKSIFFLKIFKKYKTHKIDCRKPKSLFRQGQLYIPFTGKKNESLSHLQSTLDSDRGTEISSQICASDCRF